MTNPDFVMLAKAMGVHAIRCKDASDLPEKMKEFLEYDGDRPVLLECIVESAEHVFPMVRTNYCFVLLIMILTGCLFTLGPCG
jgi:acetolactate synthase I/II/III large subunit